MEFLDSLRRSEASKKLEESIHKLQVGASSAEQRDAVQAVKDIAEQVAVKTEIKKYLPQLFALLQIQDTDEEVLQSIVDILTASCTEVDSSDGGYQASTMQGPGTLSGSGEVSFDWIKAPLDNCQGIVRNPAYVEVLLELLVLPRQGWVRMSTTQLLCVLLKADQQGTERAIEGSAAGMEKLVNVLDDDNEAVRNEMLLLLLLLTENNEQLQNFVAFRDGFSKLFQIVENEIQYENDIIVQDCLTILNNVLHGNMMTQKLFLQSGLLEKVPKILELPGAARGNGNGPRANMQDPEPGTPGDVGEIDTNCSPAKLHTISQGLQLLCYLVSGLSPAEVVDQPWYDPNGEFLPEASRQQTTASEVVARYRSQHGQEAGSSAEQEAVRRYLSHLRETQQRVGSSRAILHAVAQLAFALPSRVIPRLRRSSSLSTASEDDEAPMHTWEDLRLRALYVLGDMVCGSATGPAEASSLQLIVPRSSILGDAYLRATQLSDAACGVESEANPGATLRALLPSAGLLLAVHSEAEAEKAAASYFWECLLWGNEACQIGTVGHAITPPPDDVTDRPFSSTLVPAAGRLLVDSLLNANRILLAGSGGLSQDPLMMAADVQVRTGRLFEAVIRSNTPCKELALKVPVDALPSVSADAARDPLEPQVEEDSQELFLCFIKDLSRFCGKCVAGDTQRAEIDDGALLGLKQCCISLLRILSEWLSDSPQVSVTLFGSVSSLFLFHLCGSNTCAEDVDIRGLASLCIGLCLVNHPGDGKVSQSSVMNLVAKKIGLDRFTDDLARLGRSRNIRVACKSRRGREEGRLGLWRTPYSSIPVYDSCYAQNYVTKAKLVQDTIIQLYTSAGAAPENGVQRDPQVQAMEQYKEVIRMQDKQMNELRRMLEAGGGTVDDQAHASYVHVEELETLRRENDNLRQEKHDLTLQAQEQASKIQGAENRSAALQEELRRLGAVLAQYEQQFHQMNQDLVWYQENFAKLQREIDASVSPPQAQSAALPGNEGSTNEPMCPEQELATPPEPEAHRAPELSDSSMPLVYIEDLLSSLEKTPKATVVRVLPDLVRLSMERETRGNVQNFVVRVCERAAQVAGGLSEYEIALEMLDIARSEVLKSERTSDLERGIGRLDEMEKTYASQRSMHEEVVSQEQVPENRNQVQALQQELNDILFLLANQEISKSALFDKILELGGEGELAKAQEYCARLTHHSFISK